MLTLIIFLFTDILVVGISLAVYGRKPKYSEGMLLGVHIPEYAMEDSEVKALLERYCKRTKYFYIVNSIVSIIICFLNFWYLSIFIIAWSIWLLEMIAGLLGLVYRTHRKLYDIKTERGWQGPTGNGIVIVDTNVSAGNGKLPLSIWWHTPIFLSIAVAALIPEVQECFLENESLWILGGTVLFMALFFALMHAWTVRRRNEVISLDTAINKCLNQITKRVWSLMWIVGDYLNVLALYIVFYYTLKTRWVSGLAIVWFVIVQCITAGVIITGLFYMRWKRLDLLREDKNGIYVDDDIYWKNGWYNNPSDRKMWVQDRLNPMNYSVNMGTKGGRFYMIGVVVGMTVVFAVMFAVFLEMDFTPRYMAIKDNRVSISSPMAPVVFEAGEIQGMELLSEMPKGDFIKTNGLGDERQAVGEFREKDMGECRVYIYRGYYPILKIELPEYTIFINSQKEGQVQRWYDELVAVR